MVVTAKFTYKKNNMTQAYAPRDLFGDKKFNEILDIVADSNSDVDFCRGGSRPGNATKMDCDREAGAVRLQNDYFLSTAIRPGHLFQRRYRVSGVILFDICHKLKKHFCCRFYQKIHYNSHNTL